MRPHLFKQHGYWKVRALWPPLILRFSTFEGACRWAARIHEGN